MSQRIAITLFLLFGLLGLGCATNRPPTPASASLHRLNTVLEDKTATIILLDGRNTGNVRDVFVRDEVVEYQKGRRHTVLLSEVSRIEIVRNRGQLIGTVVGVVPGLVLLGAGIRQSRTAQKGSWDELGAGIMIATGTVAAGVGGLIGQAVGSVLGTEERIVVFERSSSSGGQ